MSNVETGHCLVVIGPLGLKKVYLDVDIDEALARYNAGKSESEYTEKFRIIFFNDEFEAYDVWEI